MNHWCVGLVLVVTLLVLSQCGKVSVGNLRNTNMEGQSANANASEQDIFETPAEITITGEYMTALLVAYEAFKRDPDIPRSKKAIENYKVEFRQDDANYIIFFFAKRPPGEPLSPGGESSLGKDVSFTIRKRDYQIAAKSFYR